MRRICIAVLATLILGAGCSGNDRNEPNASPTTADEQPEIAPSEERETTTTTMQTVWSERALATWDELDALLQRIGENLDSYTWEEAKADLRAATRTSIAFISDVAAAGPPGAVIKNELLELGRAVVDFGRELASAADCDRSDTCVRAREFVRNHIYRLRQLWAETETASR